MYLVLLSRTYPIPTRVGPARSARVSLLQNTDTLQKAWEVAFIVHHASGPFVMGNISHKTGRVEAMRCVRRWIYGWT